MSLYIFRGPLIFDNQANIAANANVVIDTPGNLNITGIGGNITFTNRTITGIAGGIVPNPGGNIIPYHLYREANTITSSPYNIHSPGNILGFFGIITNDTGGYTLLLVSANSQLTNISIDVSTGNITLVGNIVGSQYDITVRYT